MNGPVWIRIELAETSDFDLRFTYTVISDFPLSEAQQMELYCSVLEIVQSTATAMSETKTITARLVSLAGSLVAPELSEALPDQGHAAVLGALRLLVTAPGPDASSTEVVSQAMVFPSAGVEWDGALSHAASGMRIAGVVFAVASANAVLPTAALLRGIVTSTFGLPEEILDVTGAALAARHDPQASLITYEPRGLPQRW